MASSLTQPAAIIASAIDAAQTLHVSPYAFAMTVSIACCAAYVTPVSSPVNMLVMEPGGYAFGDYVTQLMAFQADDIGLAYTCASALYVRRIRSHID
jgi:di/tricarboxylate transporter